MKNGRMRKRVRFRCSTEEREDKATAPRERKDAERFLSSFGMTGKCKGGMTGQGGARQATNARTEIPGKATAPREGKDAGRFLASLEMTG
jgi:hypothetical protein